MIVNGYEIKPDADLRGADLSRAYLRGANLKGTILEDKHQREQFLN